MERVDFVTSRIDGTAEQRQVIALVDALCDHLSSPGVVDEIALANQPGQSSGGDSLLDFWKCHTCVHAHYLILMVPLELRQNPTMTPRREFASVTKRLATFFEPRNYTNVRGLFLLGY